jgi:microcin C transport system substrate-binding protein
MAQFLHALERLGIHANYRSVDYALYQKRLDAFDFDMTTLRFPDVQIPGAEQIDRFGSKAADTPGSGNLIGLKSPVVDALLKALVAAQTREQLIDAAHALDRVLMHGYYVIPQWYSATHRIAFRNTLAWPATLPRYYTANDWVISTWWFKPQH